MNRYIRLVTALCVSFTLSGCMTAQPLAIDPARLASTLQPGDRVEVVTASGQQLQFTVANVNERGVEGGGQFVSFGDIRSISRQQISAGRTALVVLGVVAAGALAASGGGGGGGSSY